MGDTDGSCADGCCKLHDKCCGSSDRSPCNAAIIKCLQGCPQGTEPGKTCMNGILPVPVFTILAAMEINTGDCCGGSCDNSGVLDADGHDNTTRTVNATSKK